MATKSKKDEPKTEESSNALMIPGVTSLDQRPDFLKKGSRRGSEGVASEDLIIPRLEVAQALSPCVNQGKADYIEGIRPGDLYNNVTREIYPRPLLFIPVTYRKDWLIWRKRTEGGGFKGAFATKDEAMAAWEQLPERDKHEILDTPQQFGLVIKQDGTVERIVISMGKTKAKVSRRLNTLVEMTGEDRWNRVYAIASTTEEIKGKGEFYNFAMQQAGYPSMVLVQAAEAFYQTVTGGGVRVSTDGIENDELNEKEY